MRVLWMLVKVYYEGREWYFFVKDVKLFKLYIRFFRDCLLFQREEYRDKLIVEEIEYFFFKRRLSNNLSDCLVNSYIR